MKEILTEIITLRRKLHEIPELPFEEKRTKMELISYMREHTKLEVVERGAWFYAKWPGSHDDGAIAFRADFDAVAGKDGVAGHFCGHDGHAAALVGLGRWITKNQPDRTIYLIFQPAEEIGQGALLCRELLRETDISEIYGFHNIPGAPKGSILILPGTFACASTGLEITVEGKPSHAAYPDAGKNPAGILSRMILYNEELLQRTYQGIVLGTVIGLDLGSTSYGVSASKGILRMTFRAEKAEDFQYILQEFLNYGKKLAQEEGMELTWRKIEEFPSTENHEECIEKLEACARKQGLALSWPKEPFRWSEDFGYYLQECKGAFFGIGSGSDWPQLHTEEYEFPDEILETALQIYVELLD